MESITHNILSELLQDKTTEEDFEEYWKSISLKEDVCGNQLYEIIKTAARTAYHSSRVDFVTRKLDND